MKQKKSAVLLKQDQLNKELKGSLETAAAIITKSYLDNLDTLPIVPPSEEDKEVDLTKCGNFYKLTKLVFNKEENFLNKLITIVNVASVIDCTLATIIRSDGSKIDYYFGLVSKNADGETEKEEKRRLANAASFKGAIEGNLTGSEIDVVSNTNIEELKSILKNGKNYSSVSGIVALRDEADKSIEGYVQGIENLVDSLKGQKYTLVMLADPIATTKLQIIKQGYEMLHTELSSFARSSVIINESDTLSISKSKTDGISKGISQGISMTQTNTKTKGKSFGFSASGGINFVVSANVGINGGFNWSSSEGVSQQRNSTENQQTNQQNTDQRGTAKTSGKSLQLNFENRSVKALLDKIDKHLERLDECESFGAFDCAAYVIADTRETALTVASNYNALMRGKESCVQASHVNMWYDSEKVKSIGIYLGALSHPRFFQTKNEKEEIIVTPASIISGNELAIQIGLPKKSVAGVTVTPMASYGRNITAVKNDSFELGCLYHMGHNEGEIGKEQKVDLDIESLSMHTFITGSTGSGKSTTIYSMLEQLMNHKVKGDNNTIKFLVVEPAKGEYKNRFGSYENVKVYGTNYKKMPLLRINPFSFPEDIHVLEHIDRLIDIFNVCWPMYAAMPAVLKDSIERAYVVAGWNLETSECRYSDSMGKPLFPSFIDVLEQVNVTMNESAYSADSKSDYKGALCTRLKSLTNGLYGQILTNNELTGKELFDSNVIIDLSRTGSSETKSLIMGLLVLKLQEYRMAHAGSGNAPLRHITVLEEAHNILKRTSTEQTSEGANVLGKSVEMLANSIAEMRTYGEGFIIADQAPGLMDMSVIRNTNTKIILRLPDIADRELVGRAAGLNDEQIVELSRLKNFVAAVYQNNWLEPVLCNIDTNFKNATPYVYDGKNLAEIDKKKLINFLFLPIEKRKELDSKYVDSLVDDVWKLSIPLQSKISFMHFAKECDEKQEMTLMEKIIYHLFNSEVAFSLAKGKQDNIKEWYDYIKGVLDPSITEMTEVRQQSIVALLTKVKAEMDNKFEFFNDFMNSPLILIERNGR